MYDTRITVGTLTVDKTGILEATATDIPFFQITNYFHILVQTCLS
jgi:hypothetical protein